MIIAIREGEHLFESTQFGFPVFLFKRQKKYLVMNFLWMPIKKWELIEVVHLRANSWLSFFGVSASVYEALRDGIPIKLVVYEI